MCGPAAPLVITTIAAAVGGAAHAKHEGGKKERKAEASAEEQKEAQALADFNIRAASREADTAQSLGGIKETSRQKRLKGKKALRATPSASLGGITGGASLGGIGKGATSAAPNAKKAPVALGGI